MIVSHPSRLPVFRERLRALSPMLRFLQLLPLILLAFSPPATAVGWKTQLNCASDYYAYCSNYAVGSADVRRCMRSNGPRLSKACVNALIADGEISRSEVDRIKETTASAKAKVKDNPKTIAADSQKPKPKDSRQAALSITTPTPPVSVQLAIDDQTYWALRKRVRLLEEGAGDVLLARDAGGGGRTEQKLPPAETLGDRQSVTNDARSSDVDEPPRNTATEIAKRGGVSSPEAQKDRKPAVTDPAKLAAEPSSPSRRAASPAGKMSLGRNNSPDNVEAAAPANGEAWDTYMQNRFSGSMNYEGLGARFSKAP